MNQNNMTLLVLGLSLAVVAILVAAPVLNNEEMAYASNTRGGAAGGGTGGTGGRGCGASSSASVACNPPTTCSAQTLPTGGVITCSDLSFLSCGGASAFGAAGGNGAAGNSGPSGAGGSGGSGGSAEASSIAGGLLTSAVAPGGLGGAGGASGPGH